MLLTRSVLVPLLSALVLQHANGYSTVIRQPLSFGRSNHDAAPSSPSFRGIPSAAAAAAAVTTTPVPFFLRHNGNSRCEKSGLGAKEDGEESETADAEAMEKKVAGRKTRLTMGYQLASSAYVAAALFVLASWGGVTSSSLYYVFGGGPLTAAAILYILKGAAIHDRLGSDTYKRLNLAIIAFAFVQLVIPTGTMPWPNRLGFKVPGFLTFVNGIKGYGYGCLGWDKSKEKTTVLTDFKQGVKSTIKGMTVIKAKSVGYVIGTLIMGSMSLLKSKELVTILLVPSSTEAPASIMTIFTKLSKMARLGLVATVMYTLKDASDRDRLSGTTFVQLNYLATAAFSSIAFYLSPTWGTASSIAQVSLVSGIAAMTLYEGIVNKKAKNA
mmetsp:Transcript_4855/g.14047  ORF Transcript_4855/g.14047 Transcript_4855/m.14047 type:complete len:384 (-) Transcript_4855:208-1359(-)